MHDIIIHFIQYFSANPTALYLLIAVLGLCIGSFLNVVIYRTVLIMHDEWEQECLSQLDATASAATPSLPPSSPPSSTAPSSTAPSSTASPMSLSFPASHCPHCKHRIRWYDNLPILSWLLLKGQCRYCQSPIGLRYPLIELLTLLASLAVVYVYGPTWAMLAGLGLTWMLIALTFIDFDSQLLPDRYTLPLAAAGLLVNSFGLYHVSASQAIWGYVIGFLSLWSVYYVFKKITGKEGMGYGDFKLLAALGAWLGPLMLPLVILLSSFVGAMIGLILLKARKENLPFAFGPYLAIAGWVAFLWGEQLMALYLGY